MSAVLDRQSTRGIAYMQLVREFTHAMLEAPESTVLTPAWHKSRATVAEVVSDNFAGTDGDAALHDLLRIVRNAAKGADVTLQALAWVATEAKRFAEVHESDRATELAEDL